MTTRGRKQKPGRITFVGSGPGDPGLLTTRARTVLANAALVFTDPDVPEAVLAMVGSELPPPSGPAEAAAGDARRRRRRDGEPTTTAIPGGPDIRPALGDPAEVAKTLAAEARTGVDVVRLVAGDPLSVDSVITEVNALARTQLHFEIVPGLPATTAVPTYAGLPLGSSHTVADVRGDVDWAALAAAPGPLILHATASHLADAARTLIEYGLADDHAVRRHRAGHHVPAAFGGGHAGGSDRQGALIGADEPAGPADRSAGRDDRQDRGQPREAELVGEPRAVRLDRAGAAHQGPGRRDERPAGRRTARCRSRCRPSPSSRRAAPRRWSAPSRVWSTAATSGSCSPPPTRCARCGRSSTSSASTPARSPA